MCIRDRNYRSYGNILNAANTVISHNLQRKGKNLFTDKGEGYPIVVYRAANEKGEADYVVNEIDNLAAEYRYEDMAILYRINAQSRAVEEALMRSGIHYRVYGGMKFYDRREVKDIVSLLRFLQNPRDDLSLFSIINVPKRGIGDAAIAAVQEAADRYGVPAYELSLIHIWPRGAEGPFVSKRFVRRRNPETGETIDIPPHPDGTGRSSDCRRWALARRRCGDSESLRPTGERHPGWAGSLVYGCESAAGRVSWSSPHLSYA